MSVQAPKEPVVLALDVGTSSVRAALYNAGGDMLPGTLAAESHAASTTPDGGAELDPVGTLELVCSALDRALQQAPGVPIVAAGMSCVWHSLMGVDADGNALTPAYLWGDTRAATSLPKLVSLLDANALYHRTACPPHPSYLPAKLLWLRDTQPELFRRVRRWLSLGEYIHLCLLGNTACGEAMASATGLYDQHSRSWYAPVLEALGIGPDALSPLHGIGDSVGKLRPEYSNRWPALADAEWRPAVGDGTCSNVGSGAARPGAVALNFGTSGAIRTVVPDPLPFPRGLWLYRIDGRRLLLGGALSNAGNVHKWLLETLRLDEDGAERILQDYTPGSAGLRFRPLLAGERSPGWSPRATGSIHGLRLGTSREDIFLAGIEGILVDFLRVYIMLHDTLREVQEVVASGGAVRKSEALRRALADVLGHRVRVCEEPEPSARGAALLALEALGVILDAGTVEAAMSGPYEPDPEKHAIYRSIADETG